MIEVHIIAIILYYRRIRLRKRLNLEAYLFNLARWCCKRLESCKFNRYHILARPLLSSSTWLRPPFQQSDGDKGTYVICDVCTSSALWGRTLRGVIKATTPVPSDLLNVFLITVRMLAGVEKLLIEIQFVTAHEQRKFNIINQLNAQHSTAIELYRTLFSLEYLQKI